MTGKSGTNENIKNDPQVCRIALPSLQATTQFGKFLGEQADPGDVICLDGDLGAGKTTLTQAIAQGLGVPGEFYVTSPTFAIFHEYPGRIPLYHMDFYRLTSGSDVIDLGLDEYFYGKGVTVIEWSKKAVDVLPENCLSIELLRDQEESRIAVITTREIAKNTLEILAQKFAQYPRK
jgi:tRNA threonylcarbamoyladenosine biosynthesis protein TsaE